MKHVWLFLPLLAYTSFAQQIKTTGTHTVVPAIKGEYTISGVTPNGKELLVTQPYSNGLYLIDLKNGKTRTVTERPEAGYNPAFSSNGHFLCFRTSDYSEKKKYSTLYKIKLSSGDTTVLVRKGRNVSCPVVVGNDLVYTVDGQLKTNRLSWRLFRHSVKKPFVLTEDLTPVLWIKGKKNVLKPGGEGSYIWVSLSPDRKKLLYYQTGKGAFVCNLNGEILISAGDLMEPKWLNNDCIIGIGSHGNEQKSTSTDVMACWVKSGKRTVITNTANVNERNPFPFSKGKKIAYRTTAGALMIATINIDK
ncbi:MAG: hypothetical protein Q8914_08845 [Bacteroidota bacterium]|nr:hypothetical protein [Bacteroidota bacterium]